MNVFFVRHSHGLRLHRHVFLVYALCSAKLEFIGMPETTHNKALNRGPLPVG